MTTYGRVKVAIGKKENENVYQNDEIMKKIESET